MGSAFLIPSQVPYPTAGIPSRVTGRLSCAGLKLSKIVSAKASPLFSAPLSLSCGLQKYNLFHYRQYFFSIIFQFYHNWLIPKMKNFARQHFCRDIGLLLIYRDSNNAVFIVKIYGINIGLFISCQRIAVLDSGIKR